MSEEEIRDEEKRIAAKTSHTQQRTTYKKSDYRSGSGRSLCFAIVVLVIFFLVILNIDKIYYWFFPSP